MFEREKPIMQEVPKSWKSCVVKIADKGTDDIKSEVAAIKKGMEIADFFATKHGIIAKGDGRKVILEAKPNTVDRKISNMEDINIDLQKMINEGTLTLFLIE